MSQAPLNDELLDIGYKSIIMVQKIYAEREDRVEVAEQLKQIYTLLEEQELELSRRTKPEQIPNPSSNSSSGGYPSSGGGYSNGGSGGSSSGGGNSSNNENTNNNNNNTSNTQQFNADDYKPIMSFNLASDDISGARQNLAAHAETVKGILAYVSVNGEVIGGDVYGVTGVDTDSDVGFNFGALQLACDAVNADVEAISAHITQMKNKIATNKQKIASTTAEMNKKTTVTRTDAKGNKYTEEVWLHSDSERSAYQAQIEALEAENTQLTADIASYTTEMNNKKEVYQKLINLRNTYNNVYGGLVNAFTANDIINALNESGNSNSLLGMSLTDAQKTELFNNLGSSLLENQGNLTLTIDDNFNLMNGEYPLGAYQYLLGACSILGNSENSFGENFTLFQEFRQSIAATLEYDETSNKDSNVDANGKISGNANTDDINGTNGQIMVNGRPVSTKVLNSVVEQFMTNNKGQMVTIPQEVKDALDLNLDAMISIPKDYTTTEDWPLLMWLAGTGTAGGDTNNLKSSVFIKNIVSGQYTVDGAILYAPVGWGSGASEGNNSTYDGELLNHDFNNLIKGLNIDENHISGMGISVGAFALASIVDKNPNTFASTAFCGGGFGGPWGNITIENAIANSPNTSYIWYNANNDETSPNSLGVGVHSLSLQHHQQLLDAGINSVYYEIGGDIWHTNACDRFVTDAMVNDLIAIERGQKYSVPSGVQNVSAQDAYNASITAGGTTNNWYVPISGGIKTGTASARTNGSSQQTTQTENTIPDIFNNIKGDIPDISDNEKATGILETVPIPAYNLKDAELFAKNTGFRSPYTSDDMVLDPRYLKDGYIVYSQLGNIDEDGNFIRDGWDNLFYINRDVGVYSANWLKSIRESGCSVASAAMIVSNLTHQNITPDYVKTLYHNSNANIGYGFSEDVFGTYGLEYAYDVSINGQNSNGEFYYDNLLRNGGAIIHTVNSGSHYIAILGVKEEAGTKQYFIADPNTQSPGEWVSVDSTQFNEMKNSTCESSVVVAPPGMDINEALSSPYSTTNEYHVENHRFRA